MSPNGTTYMALMAQLLTERELEGGTLPDEREADYAGRLDDLWWRLGSQEQDLIEHRLRDDESPQAPAQLDEEDQQVRDGDRQSPRRAA